MVFGHKKEIEKLKEEIAYLRGIITALQQQPQKQQESEQPQEIKSSWSQLKKKMDTLDKLSVLKKIEKIEKRLGITNEEPEEPSYDLQQPATDGNNIDIEYFLKNPMIRIALNSFLKQYNTSVDDLKAHPEKLIDLLESFTNTLKKKKEESEKENKPFNPYDPSLFFKH
ncbi:MAG: hypothetical protein QXE51_04010 [Nitrososphaeria archaeon]